MKISIVTVSYNSSKTIQDTIESVLRQTYRDIEYIIVDGGSTDETLQVVKKYAERIDILISAPDEGIYDAMNKGISVATGDIVGILNSDDFYEDKNVIQIVAAAFQEYASLDILFGEVVFVSPKNLKNITRYYSSGHFRPWKLRFGWMPPHPATFVRRSVYKKFGLYRLDYQIASDFEMFVRWLYVAGLSYRWIDKVFVRMRTGGVSTSGLKSNIKLVRENVRACQDNGLYTNILFILTKFPFKLTELWRRPSRNRCE